MSNDYTLASAWCVGVVRTDVWGCGGDAATGDIFSTVVFDNFSTAVRTDLSPGGKGRDGSVLGPPPPRPVVRRRTTPSPGPVPKHSPDEARLAAWRPGMRGTLQ